ncbi:MAG: TRAP transporter substrate-binding protein [Oribacterium sp.]|nr:TRAP transporter substrate-binding protein [Oribacterium sp.]
MNKKICFCLSIVLSCMSILTSCGSAKKEQESVTFRYAELAETDHPLTSDAHYFADRVKELSKGRINIDIYDNAQLGAEKEAVQATQMGTVDICRGTVTLLADFDMPMLNILGLPYMFSGREHCWKVLDGEIGDKLRSYPAEQKTGLVGLWFAEEGSRSLITVDGPVTGISDIKGRKIRVNNASLMIDTVNAMGASAVPMAYTEVYTSLQSGVIEGLENIAAGYNSASYYEVAPYYALTRHITSVSMVVMNEAAYNKLSDEDKSIIKQASLDTEQFARKNAQEYDERAMKELNEKGVLINEVSDIDAWREAVKPVQEKYGAGYEELIGEIDSLK